MSFKVGERVFVEGVIIKIDTDDQPYLVKVDTDKTDGDDAVTFWFHESRLIPASRVTVAPTRRAAEFPKDWGKMAWFSDDGKEWGMSKLTGCDAEGTSNEWCNETGQWFDFCEVEE